MYFIIIVQLFRTSVFGLYDPTTIILIFFYSLFTKSRMLITKKQKDALRLLN